MRIRGLIEEDFVNYKKASMFLAFPFCSFKCEKECGIKCCQNSPTMKLPIKEVETDWLVERYLGNPITHAIVLGGLEPFDSFDDVLELVQKLRAVSQDDVVIYTGYNKDEVLDKLETLKGYPNIIVKFGRFRPNDRHRFDEVLGVELASENQYAEKIS